MNRKIDEITISIPADKLTEDEQITLLAVYVRERENNSGELPTSITTDEEKINFTFNLSPTADITTATERFTSITMDLCEKARRDAKRNKKPNQQPKQLPIRLLLKIREQILSTRAGAKYNMFDIPAVASEADQLGYTELADFLEEHKVDYTHFIFTGDLQNLTLSLYPIPGSRVVLDEMPHDPNPVPVNTVGTVEGYDDECEILMSWDNGRKLKLIPGIDQYHIEI